jgi:hypothetical protein
VIAGRARCRARSAIAAAHRANHQLSHTSTGSCHMWVRAASFISALAICAAPPAGAQQRSSSPRPPVREDSLTPALLNVTPTRVPAMIIVFAQPGAGHRFTNGRMTGDRVGAAADARATPVQRLAIATHGRTLPSAADNAHWWHTQRFTSPQGAPK